MCLANFLKISFVIQTHVFRKLSDLMIEWSEITIWLVITFLWCSRSWSWSDLRSLFKQVILIWSQITFRVILQFFDSKNIAREITYVRRTVFPLIFSDLAFFNIWTLKILRFYTDFSIFSLFENSGFVCVDSVDLNQVNQLAVDAR